MYGSLTNHQIRLNSSSSHNTTSGVAVGEGETVFPVRHDPARGNKGLIKARPELIIVVEYLGRLPALGMIFQERVMVTFLWLSSPLPSSQK